MVELRRILLAAAVVLGAMGTAAGVEAGSPRYLILESTPSGTFQPLPARPYSYGWFGVPPRGHSAWHHGYSGDTWYWRVR